MPGPTRGLQCWRISPHGELVVMASLGTVRSVMNSFLLTWDGNVQKIWDLPGPEPSFSMEYHFDYWLKTILSLVVIFRNFTMHIHLILYVIVLYPLLTGRKPCLMLPWLCLQVIRNIITNGISIVAGVLRCWILRTRALLVAEFLLVEILSTMPSIYLWYRLRSYYFHFYYAKINGASSSATIKPGNDVTLAQRRRASKTLHRSMIPAARSFDDRARVSSCLTYEELISSAIWKENSDNKISRSLSSLSTVKSEESDLVDDDRRLNIIDDENLTLVEKTLKILGLTREEMNKRTSTTGLEESITEFTDTAPVMDLNFSFFATVGDLIEPLTVAVQVGLPAKSVNEDRKVGHLKYCECCESTKCSKVEDVHSDEEATSAMQNPVDTRDPLNVETPLKCCDKDRAENREMIKDKSYRDVGEEFPVKFDESMTKGTILSGHSKSDSDSGTCLSQSVVKPDRRPCDNFRDVNFVSVINNAFKTPRDCYETLEKIDASVVKTHYALVDPEGKNLPITEEEVRNGQSMKEIVAVPEIEPFSGPTSASFGVESEILALNASRIFDEFPCSVVESFSSIAPAAKRMGFDSYFNSSFQRHSNMFDGSINWKGFASFNPPTSSRVGNDVSTFYETDQISAEVKNCSNDLSEYTRARAVENDSQRACNSGLYRSSSISPAYFLDNYDSLDSRQRILSKNEIHESTKPGNAFFDSHAQHVMDSKTSIREQRIRSPIFMNPERLSSGRTSITECNYKLDGVTQTSTTKTTTNSVTETLRAGPLTTSLVSILANSRSNLEATMQNEDQNGSRDLRSLASLSRSSKMSRTRETPEEREAEMTQALKAYNEQTLGRYKREMDAYSQYSERLEESTAGCSSSTHEQNRSQIQNLQESWTGLQLSRLHQGHFNLPALYVPSAPELETPEKELILNIENAYARFTRSKPVDSTTTAPLRENCTTKEAFGTYSVAGRPRRDSQKAKICEELATRKQHSKYSKLARGAKEFDVNLSSCKRIEGSQKGRDLERTLGMENILAHEVAVYFVERQLHYGPSTSGNVPITTIKSVSGKRNADAVSGTSSDSLPSNALGSPMIEVLSNAEEIPVRIEDNERHRRTRTKHLPQNVKEAVDNIDWSFQRSTYVKNNHQKQTKRTVWRTDQSLERQDIVNKTTENLLQSAFAYSENSERGFHLGDSANEIYPIFHNVAITMEEIVRSAALKGYSHEFTSHPDTEIEIPTSDNDNLYSRRLRRCNILTDDTGTVKQRSSINQFCSTTMSTVPDYREDLEAEEKNSSLLSKLVEHVEFRSAEVNVSLLDPEDVPEELEDLPSPHDQKLEDYSSFSSPRKRCYNPERSLHTGPKLNESSERGRVALHDAICGSAKFDVATYQGILDCFDSSGKEMQSLIVKVFDRFPCRETLSRNGIENSSELRVILDEGVSKKLRGSETIAWMQILGTLQQIKATAGRIMEVVESSEETAETSSTGENNSSSEENDHQSVSQAASSQEGISSARNLEDEKGSDDLGQRSGQDKKRNRCHGLGASTENENDQLSDEKKKRLLNKRTDVESVSPTASELLRRDNFRRSLIDSGIVESIKGENDLAALMSSLIDSSDKEEVKVRYDSSTSYETIDERKFRNSMSVPPEVEIPELLITDDKQATTGRESVRLDRDQVFISSDTNAVLRDIEDAERAIQRMKRALQKVFAEDSRSREQAEKNETQLNLKRKVSSLANLKFSVNDDLQKFQNLIRVVANYATIAKCSSDEISRNQMVNVAPASSGFKNNFGTQRRELDALEPSLEAKSNIVDDHSGGSAVPKPTSSRKDSQGIAGSRDDIDRFSSWDAIIPLSTRRQIAKSKRKSKPAEMMLTAREPPRRSVKVVKLIEEKNLDFFSARSVPQRGRGLSSGYLRDSDSDGNLTGSRPSSPVSVESATSQTRSYDVETPDVFSNQSKASEIFPVVDEQMNSKCVAVQRSLENSTSRLLVDAGVSATRTSDPLDVVNDAMGSESLSTGTNLRYLSTVDTAEIENKLRDVVRQILSYQYSRVQHVVANDFPSSSKNASCTSMNGTTKTDTSIDLEPNTSNREIELNEPHDDCNKKIEDIPSGNTPVQQLVTNFKAPDLSLESSEVVSFEVSPRNSKISLRSAAIGTEYNTEIFKDLLDLFSKHNSSGSNSNPGYAFQTEQSDYRNKNHISGNVANEREALDVDESNASDKEILMQSVTLGRVDEKCTPEFDVNMRAAGSHDTDSTLSSSLEKHSKEATNSSGLEASPVSSFHEVFTATSTTIEGTELGNSVSFTVIKSADDMPINTTTLENQYCDDVEENLKAPKFSSYDSFESNFYQTTPGLSVSSRRTISLSICTHLEDFPEQGNSTLQLSQMSSDSVDERSSEAMKSKSEEGARESDSKEQKSLASSDNSSYHGSNGSSKKEAILRKTGIPRPVKGSKDRK